MSSFLFDLDISELGDDLSYEVIPFGYADVMALWYEVDSDYCITTAVINQDLQSLRQGWSQCSSCLTSARRVEIIY